MIALAVALLFVAAAGAFFWREARRWEGIAIAYVNRLLAAQKEGYIIPPPELKVDDLPEAPKLIPQLQQLVDSWEDPRAQAAQLSVIETHLNAGRSQMETYRLIVPNESEL